MQKLVDGIHRFQNTTVNSHRELFRKLASGQKPEACLITCSDSRIDPNLVTNTEPGDLFIVRNVGNIIPPHGTPSNSVAAAVEFAIVALGVKDIIVCGHNHCGAMKGLLNPEIISELPAVRSWLVHAEASGKIIHENYQHLSGNDLLTATAEENVLVQLSNLNTLPIVASRVSAGKVNLHGWMYKIETGEIFAYNAEERQFSKLSRVEEVVTAA